jgi:excisionase family DNA binding protein
MSGQAESLMSPAQVAVLFRVHPNTVTQWERAGKLTAVRTAGGHRRFREAEVRALLRGGDVELLPTRVVAALFRVDPKTVARWAVEGLLLPFCTPGGMRRYYGSEVRALQAGEDPEAARKLAEADRDRIAWGPP